MRIGIAGVHYGHIGGLLRSARNAPNGEIVGIVEADDAMIEKHKAGDIPRFKSVDEMIDKAGVELVLEGLAHDEKVGLVETCGPKGVHVALDKPLCSNLDHWTRIKAAVDASDIRLTMFFTSRFYPPFVALRHAIEAGELGTIVSLITTHPHKLGQNPPALYFDADRYAGTFHDIACHGIDQIRWLTGGEVTGISAVGALIKNTAPPRKLTFDHVQASFTLSTGAAAVATSDWLTPDASPSFGDTRFILMGTEGSAHLRAYAEDGLLLVSHGKGRYTPEFPDSGTGDFIENYIGAIERGEQGIVSTHDVLSVARACIAAEESARDGGRFIHLDG